MLLERMKKAISAQQPALVQKSNSPVALSRTRRLISQARIQVIDRSTTFDHLIQDGTITAKAAKELALALRDNKTISDGALKTLCEMAIHVLDKEPNVVRLPYPAAGCTLTVVGDLHASFNDLLEIFENQTGWPSDTNHYIFGESKG